MCREQYPGTIQTYRIEVQQHPRLQLFLHKLAPVSQPQSRLHVDKFFISFQPLLGLS